MSLVTQGLRYPTALIQNLTSAISWLNNPDSPVNQSVLLDWQELESLGRTNGYFDALNAFYSEEPAYRQGWRQGVQDRNRAIAAGMLPSEEPRPLKFWSEADE